MRTATRRVLGTALLAAAIVAGCGGDDSTAPSGSVAGTYQLQTVNGQALPATTVEVVGSFRVEVTGGTFVLRSDQTYTETINIRTISATGTSQSSSQVEDGTYTINGPTILFTIPANATDPVFSYEGTLNEGTLSYVFDGTAIVYHK